MHASKSMGVGMNENRSKGGGCSAVTAAIVVLSAMWVIRDLWPSFQHRLGDHGH